MRDSARFHFGFTVPFVAQIGALAAVAAVAASKGDLALVHATLVAGARAWWPALEGEREPKIIARLPFVERADHPAGLPVFVVSRSSADAMMREVEMWSVKVAGWGVGASRAIAPLADFLAVPDPSSDGAALLVSVPQNRTLDEIVAALVGAGASVASSVLVGSHATRYTVPPSGLVARSR